MVLEQNRGCFGCCDKPQPCSGLKIQGGLVNNKPSFSEDFWWSTSTCDLDNSTTLLESQRSLSSSMSFTNSTNTATSSSSSNTTNHTTKFVNHGLNQWNQTRQQWLANGTSRTKSKRREPTISWNATYESLLGMNKRFSRSIPLHEMVDFLVDVWEQEGLYD
ncbi:unnamed protein product [Cochlearia groenlandica]